MDDTIDMKYPTHEHEMREIDQPGILFRREYDDDMDDLPQFAWKETKHRRACKIYIL